MNLLTRPLAASDAEAMAQLFEAVGSACYCRYLHFPGDKNDWQARCALSPEDNLGEMRHAFAAEQEESGGVGAFDPSGLLLGFAKVTMASAVEKAWKGRYYGGLPIFSRPRERVMLLSCSLVRPEHRKQGIFRALASAAIDYARARGALTLEALPRRSKEATRDEELWTGVFSVLAALGFEVLDGDESYPVMQLSLLPGERP